jgi:hypothetical protein
MPSEKARGTRRAVAARSAAAFACLGAAAAGALAGCVGRVGSGGSGTGTNPDPTNPGTPSVSELCAQQGPALHVGRTRLRRLTRSQLSNTLRDLLGTTGNPAASIAPDERIGPFLSNGIAPITDLIVQQHQEAAASLAVSVQARMSEISPCNLAADSGETCARQFVTELGRRAYRRPLDAGEVDEYVALFSLGRSQADAQNGFRMVVEAVLQSPFFLYHVDVGSQDTPSMTPVPLKAHELAARLSYFLWDSMPDRALDALADNGEILSASVLTSEVERMLADRRAGDAIPAFHLQWLGIGEMDDVSKDATLFPRWNAELAAAMRAETAAFTDHVVRRGDGLIATLFTAPFSFPQGPLFALYGVTQPSGFMAGTQVDLDPAQRGGVLTQGAFLATHAHRDQTSPVHRGIVVRENMLCQTIPAPPPEVNAGPLPPAAGTSARDRFAAHEADPTCGTCHKAMDPIGLAFENYDAVGAYRTEEGGVTIDATGEIVGARDEAAGRFVGAIELGQKLAASQQVWGCMADQWFRFALGRMEANDDACARKAIHEGFSASGGNIRQLITALVLSDSFRHVRSVGGGP